MGRSRKLISTFAAAAILVLGACSTEPVGPPVVDVIETADPSTPTDPEASDPQTPDPETPDPEPPDSIPDPPTSGSQATVLQRSSPLAEDEIVTRVVGPLGDIIVLPEAGLTVIIPPLALLEATEITVTAPAGELVGYHFAPHGLRFNLPVVVQQDLATTLNAGLGSTRAVYFEGELAPQVTILEELPLRLLELLGIFDIHHFSGYIIATN